MIITKGWKCPWIVGCINTSLMTVATEEKDSDNFQEVLLTEKAEPQSNREKRVFV